MGSVKLRATCFNPLPGGNDSNAGYLDGAGLDLDDEEDHVENRAGDPENLDAEPAPEREKKRTWKRFMKVHWESLYACDFFNPPGEQSLPTYCVIAVSPSMQKSQGTGAVVADGIWN